MDIKTYAAKILADNGCDCHTYGGEFAKHIMNDLKAGYPEGMEFPYIEVANEILAMSRPAPIERPPYRMVWDSGSCCDGTDHDSFAAAMAAAEDTLFEWAAFEQRNWGAEPTEEEKESWDYMVYNCGVRVDKYNPDTDCYEEFWAPSQEELDAMGWKPL